MPTKAKQLLADAGYPDGQGFPEISLTYTATSTQEKKSAEYLQGIWKQTLGINVKLDPLEDKAFEDWFNSRDEQPFNLLLSFWGSDWGDPGQLAQPAFRLPSRTSITRIGRTMSSTRWCAKQR